MNPTESGARPRLTAELVPSTCWWSNLRSNTPRSQWAKCQAFVRTRSGDRCEVCGGRGPQWPVECHEVWGYDDTTHVQTLTGLIALCPACHEVKHIGRASAIGNLAPALSHLMAVNGWTGDQATDYLDGVWDTWRARSKHQWTLDVSWLGTIGINIPPITDRPGH
jgi:predicted amidophosphoribosyltransferase